MVSAAYMLMPPDRSDKFEMFEDMEIGLSKYKYQCSMLIIKIFQVSDISTASDFMGISVSLQVCISSFFFIIKNDL